MASNQGESAQKGMSRKQCVINGGGCSFSVSANPNADGSAPWYELDSMSQVGDHALTIDKVAAGMGVDARLIRSIMYVETTHGYYDAPLSLFGANKSILPMNINVDYWGDAFGSRSSLLNSYHNIRAGASMIQSIQANMSGGSVSQIGTLYNNINATSVSNYGARVNAVYNSQPWQ
jgi:hypothetical protein